MRAIRPYQVARRGFVGCSVEVPPEGLFDLIRALGPSERVVVRLHSHPGDAFHSDLDDTNMLISHDGAISVVVPYFARDDLRLTDCAVFELREGQWVELCRDEISRGFIIYD